MNKVWLPLLTAICVSLGCSSDDATNSGDGASGEIRGLTDPYSALRDRVTNNAVACDEQACCWYDCQYEQVVCGQQNGNYAAVGATLDGFDLGSAPDWWREKRFYLISYYEMNVLSGRTDRNNPRSFYVGAYCESGSFHSAYTLSQAFENATAFRQYLNEGPPDYNCDSALDACDGHCTASCTGRKCGSDGCGGTCGTCGVGDTCNNSGQCVSSGGDNVCDACLSTCRGIPGCCTGCGCLCEDKCGGCW